MVDYNTDFPETEEDIDQSISGFGRRTVQSPPRSNWILGTPRERNAQLNEEENDLASEERIRARSFDWVLGIRGEKSKLPTERNNRLFPSIDPFGRDIESHVDLRSQRQKDYQNVIEKFLDGIDQQLLFETIDSVVTTVETLKPLFKEIKTFSSPFIKKLKKK